MKSVPVIRHKMDIPYTEIVIWFPGGVVAEKEKESGFAHFSEHLIFKMSHGGKRPADFVEELGGNINAWTSMDFVALTITVMNRYVPDVISYFQNLLSFDFSTVSEEDFKEECSVVIEEKLMYHDDPVEKLVLEVRKKVYGNHSYGRDISGKVNVLRNATQNELDNFYKNSLRRSPFVTCVGGYDGKVFLSLPASMGKVPTKIFKKRSGEKIVIKNNTQKYYFMAGWALPFDIRSMVMIHLIKTMISSLSSAEFYNSLVFENRIFDELLVETLNANTSLFLGHLGVFSGDRRSERLEKWLSLWENYVFSMEEFSKAVELFVRRRRLFSENPEVISDSMGKSFFMYGEAEKLSEKYLSALYSITLDELNNFKQNTLGFDNMTIGVSMPEGEKPFDLNTIKRGDLKKRSSEVSNYVRRKNKKAILSVLERNSSQATLYLMKKAGVSMEKENKSGVSGLFMRCLGSSGKSFSRKELEDHLDSYCMDLSVVDGNNSGSIKITGGNNFVDEIFRIAEEVISNPICENDFKKEKHHLLQALTVREQSPSYHMNIEIFKNVFSGTKYASLADRTYDSVSALTLDDVYDFREEFLSRGIWGVGLCGGVSHRHYDSVPNIFSNYDAAPFNTSPMEIKPVEGRVSFDSRGRSQCYLARVSRIPGILSDDFEKMVYISEFLSGQSSILFRELREKKGLVYTYSVVPSGFLPGGCISIEAVTSPDKYKKVINAVEKCIAEICDNAVDEKNLTEKFRRTELQHSMRMRSNSYHSFNLAYEEAMGLPSLKYQHYLEVVKNIKTDKVAELTKTYLKKGMWFISDNC